jgi:hypothetical protein
VGSPQSVWTPLLQSPRFRREDNIRMNLKEVGCESVDWIRL